MKTNKQEKIGSNKKNAEKIRIVAMENLIKPGKEKQKKKLHQIPLVNKEHNTRLETLAYLKTRAENDLKIRQEEIDI